MIAGNCRLWARKRTPDPDNMWSKCWIDMPYAPRSFEACESLQEYYEGEWGNIYEYKITSTGWGCAPKPTMPGAPA
jgi:hypothetical protein